ncbi:MAG: rRNA maturation RNase YbeY [Candidatus Cloacimonetes bacterium]|nr:rRNA maturation RNase YbeY [Candidatus Cloacimonadota bacterium]
MNTPKINGILFDNKTSRKIDVNLFVRVRDLLLSNQEMSSQDQVSVLLVEDETIAILNQKFLGRTGKTDVISFPCDFPEINFLGDIIIDIQVADLQKGMRSLETELQFLFLHGILHLLGYDHLGSFKQNQMKEKENYYQTHIMRFS